MSTKVSESERHKYKLYELVDALWAIDDKLEKIAETLELMRAFPRHGKFMGNKRYRGDWCGDRIRNFSRV